VILPYNYVGRKYQLPVLHAIDSGKYKRAVVVWHRRSGKDKTLINLMVKMCNDKPGVYYYLFPTYAQGKKILWDGRDRDGFPYMAHFPDVMVKHRDKQEMKLELRNGSIFQVIGTDKIDSIVGTNPIGCIFSEYALQNPKGWDYISPILLENKGWAVFNYTPRGNNHGKTLYLMAKDNPDWFCQLLTVDDTRRPDGTPVITQEEIDQQRREGKTEDFIQQEYYCSFTGMIEGSYYSRSLELAESEGRITNVPHETTVEVETAWDLGVGDSTAIWFIQRVGKEIRFIDYYETTGEGLPFYVKVLREKSYTYGRHYAPHDIMVRELGTGKSRYETAQKLGIDFDVVPRLSVDDGIDACRNMLTRCWFDKEKVKKGLSSLWQYHKEVDEKAGEYEGRVTFKNKPHHDWSSHGADSFRTYAVGRKGIDKASRAPEFYDVGAGEQSWMAM
tara:strand:- start:301 stop:1635 length:1335 start_codon:yes stop_codon:yes gene_type:complete